MKSIGKLVAFLSLTLPCAGQQGWWMREPIRWVQTNLRETDAALDPQSSSARSRISTPTSC